MKAISTIVAVLFICHTAYGQDEVAIIVDQPNSPIKITRYNAEYRSGTGGTNKGINHQIRYINSSERKVMAVQVGLVSFNIFNQFINKMNGVDMSDSDPGKERRATWVARASADFSLLTGVAYVAAVRYENGDIWEANNDVILEELRLIEDDLDAAILEEVETD